MAKAAELRYIEGMATASVYRMVTDQHICPFGLKAKDLLKREGFEVEDHTFSSKEEVQRFKEEHGVKTTPQVWIGDQRIGGYEDLRKHLGKEVADPNKKSYTPVVAVFATTALMAAALSGAAQGAFHPWALTKLFVALSMCVLAILKLRDLRAFSNQFITYDLLAMRWIRYAYIYPFAEAFVGVGMLANIWPPIVIAVAAFIGSIGAISVIKAVYVDKRDLKCACVGGNSNVPLGFISLSENLAMVAMAIAMTVRFL